MKVTRRRGRLQLRLEPIEVDLLSILLDELDALLDGSADADDDGVLQRLNPAAYPDDEASEREYRELTAAGLRTDRSERTAACRADLSRSGDIDLSDPDAGRRWLQVLNDLRLALGTRLGITEDDTHEVDPDDPAAQSRVVYAWLTAVQDSLVHGMLR
ncbi:MAG TPA: DUF2017 family protein [Jatrophihabitans sp.]|nr:DUF2017 family protein [Jatrophihabitans sp.]